MASNTKVEDWLRSLGLLTYADAFIDNGYDDLDICKQIGDEDLDAIGVINSKDRKDILNSVKSLRDQGVHAVYFQLESNEQTTNPNFSQSDPDRDREKYRRGDLINKMRDLLAEDNCVLPENNPNFEHDPLDDLAQYYADQLYTYLRDVKEVLEYLRDSKTNEDHNLLLHSSPKGSPKHSNRKHLNTKLEKESRLSKSLNSLDSALGKAKAPKSPKSGIGRIFSGRRKNYVQQPPKITGPAETAIIASQVQMSDEDRKNLMLKVKHGDITQEEALNNFLSYEATHTPFSKDTEMVVDNKQQKKKRSFFNRSSFKRHSSGPSSEVLASNIALGEKERMELMRKIKAGEITTEEAWDCLRRFGNKRDSKHKSPKLRRKGTKSSKNRERISASSIHISSTFYTGGVNSDISQSTSNIPSRTGSTDSSPDSTPGLPRKWDVNHCHANSADQLRSSGSFESMDAKGNYSKPRNAAPPLPPKLSPSPLTHSEVRRTLSAKNYDVPKETTEAKRRSTMPNFSNVEENRSATSNEKFSQNSKADEQTIKDNGSVTAPPNPPVPPRKPPKLPPNKPSISQIKRNSIESQEDSHVNVSEGKKSSSLNGQDSNKPMVPDRPTLPGKLALLPKPPAKLNLKPNISEKPPVGERGDKITNNRQNEKREDVSLINGTDNENYDHAFTKTSTKGETTSQEKVGKVKSRVPPRRPSPLTRVSRNKPQGPDLLEMIENKLTDEGIDLTHEPYTGQDGEWGVPMALVDRYSRELHSTMREVTKEMDHIRIEKLNLTHKMGTPCDLSKLQFALDVVGKLTSMADWLTSLGLPMYIDNLTEAGYDDFQQIPYLSEEHLNYANITNPEHIHRLTISLENMTPIHEKESPSQD